MNINELRVGNWYKWYAEGNYYEYRVKDIDFCNGNMINFDPIPLTDEFLTKHGIINKITEKSKVKKMNPFYTFPMAKRGKSYVFIINDFYNIEISYVHQFQNLFFSLTGIELEDWESYPPPACRSLYRS